MRDKRQKKKWSNVIVLYDISNIFKEIDKKHTNKKTKQQTHTKKQTNQTTTKKSPKPLK